MSRGTDTKARRRSILTAAEGVFEAHGYAAATIEQVAAKAGVAKGSVYNYFQSKQDLFRQVLTEALSEDEAELGRLVASRTRASEKLQGFFDWSFSRLEHCKRVGGLILESWAKAAQEEDRGQMSETFHQVNRRWRDRVAAIIDEGIRCGEFIADVQPRQVASLILALLDGLTVHAIMGAGDEIDDKMRAELRRGLMRALTGDAGEKGAAAIEGATNE